uniref:Uncharacterized protein n=1 Tax=Triticum urartu TaxID=4572 RepID=A0A8R7QXF7_TRIUA
MDWRYLLVLRLVTTGIMLLIFLHPASSNTEPNCPPCTCCRPCSCGHN